MQKIGEYIRLLQLEITSMISTFKDKGSGRFSRPLLLSMFTVYATYYAVYQPATKKLAGLQKRIDSVKATIQYAEQYKTLAERLKESRTRLPTPAGRGSWLTNAVIEAMKEEGVIADSIEPPQELIVGQFYHQKVTVTVRAKFQQLAAVLHRLETTKPLIHIHSLNINKGGADDELGINKVEIGVSTLVPQ